MFVFIVKILPEQIATYLSSVLVPDYLQNLQLEPVTFDADKLNSDGTQPLLLHYSAHGRLEDFELCPEEHCLPLVKEVLPELWEKEVERIQNTVLWTWNAEAMTIWFRPRHPALNQVGKECGTNEGFVSVSRKTLFLSFALFQRYFAEQYRQIGLQMPEEVTTQWDHRVGGVVCSGEPVSAQFLLSDAESLRDILQFSRLDKVLEHVRSWVRVQWEELTQLELNVTPDGIYLPLLSIREE